MKILAFSDTHDSFTAFRRLEQKIKSQKPDILVCAGDISIFEHGIVGILRKFNRLNRKIIMVHGNHEDDATFARCSGMFRNIIFIHKKYYVENDTLFFGFGGGGFAAVDKEFDKLAKGKLKKIISQNKDNKIILLTHGPPYGTKLDKLGRTHCGNKSYTNFVKKNNVSLMISGHLHENFGKEDHINKTKIINPGPFGKIIDV